MNKIFRTSCVPFSNVCEDDSHDSQRVQTHGVKEISEVLYSKSAFVHADGFEKASSQQLSSGTLNPWKPSHLFWLELRDEVAAMDQALARVTTKKEQRKSKPKVPIRCLKPAPTPR
jgi:hypothetical protein